MLPAFGPSSSQLPGLTSGAIEEPLENTSPGSAQKSSGFALLICWQHLKLLCKYLTQKVLVAQAHSDFMNWQ